MTPAEIRAFNAGVSTVLDLARATSTALAPAAVHRVTRIGFAQAALDGLAEEGRALLLPLLPDLATRSALSTSPRPHLTDAAEKL